MKMKKICSLLMALTLAAGLFSGCGRQGRMAEKTRTLPQRDAM